VNQAGSPYSWCAPRPCSFGTGRSGTSTFDPALGNNSNFSLFPTGLLQVLYGPLYILLHIFSIRALVRRALGRDRAVHTIAQNA